MIVRLAWEAGNPRELEGNEAWERIWPSGWRSRDELE